MSWRCWNTIFLNNSFILYFCLGYLYLPQNPIQTRRTDKTVHCYFALWTLKKSIFNNKTFICLQNSFAVNDAEWAEAVGRVSMKNFAHINCVSARFNLAWTSSTRMLVRVCIHTSKIQFVHTTFISPIP